MKGILVIAAFILMGLAIYSQNTMSGIVALWTLFIGSGCLDETLGKGTKKNAQLVDITVHNPLSEDNLESLSDRIIDSINRAGKRNIKINVK